MAQSQTPDTPWPIDWPEFRKAVEAGDARVVIEEPDRVVLVVPDRLLYGDGEESRQELVRTRLQAVVRLAERDHSPLLAHLLVLLAAPVDHRIWIRDLRTGVPLLADVGVDSAWDIAQDLGTGVPIDRAESRRCRSFGRQELLDLSGCSLAVGWLAESDLSGQVDLVR